ncbi:hypothetical protein [Bradyrhizobium sp. USDA 10063]
MSEPVTKFSLALGSKSIELNVSTVAAKTVSNIFGGLSAAHQRVTAIDLTSMAQIVSIGLGKSQMEISLAALAGAAKSTNEVEQQLYEAGVVDLAEPLRDYLNLLANGGRPPKTDDEA